MSPYRKKYWSARVTRESNALDTEPGVFTFKDPRQIARSLKRSAELSERRKAKPFPSAMSMLNFYINRAGKNLRPSRRKILEQAKSELRGLFKNSYRGSTSIMKFKKLSRSFYTKDTLAVAEELLGKYLVRKIGRKKLRSKIIETEAYIGPQDRASHAYKGKITPRNQAEYLVGGHIYIYLVYGMYWQLNISTGLAGQPECVLIRALKLPESEPQNLADGPGKLCRYLKLDKSFYGEDLTKSERIWLEDPAPERARYGVSSGEKIKSSQIIATRRIGIDYAGPYWAKRKWRFLLK